MGINRLYIVNVEALRDKQKFEYFFNEMDEERKKKIMAFKPESSRLLSLGAGILLKRAFSDCGISDHKLLYSEKGKPYIDGYSDIYFNLSHSGSMAVIGISDKEIGVDIEMNREFKQSLIDYVFSEDDNVCAKEIAERTLLQTADRRDEVMSYSKAYTLLWTVKESVMKHSGEGVSLAPKSIILSLVENDEEKMIHSNRRFNSPERAYEISAFCKDYNCSGLKITSFDLGDYQLSVCSEYGDFEGPEVVEL